MLVAPGEIKGNSPTVSAEPVCIAGMHRSGTSMVTSLLKDCGLFLGAEQELGGKASDNTKGFWENLNFVRLNEDILAHFGGSWDKPPTFPFGWEFDESVQPLELRAKELVQGFNHHELWGWKDPRNSLTLPLWRKIIPSLRFVVCVRNPLEVEHSRFVRGDSMGASQFELWQHYYQQILATAPVTSRIVTHYQSYFEDARAEVLRVTGWLGLKLSEETTENILANVSGVLRHHYATTADMRTEGASDEVVELYLRLCDEAGPVCRQFIECETQSGATTHKVSGNTLDLKVMRLDNQLAKSEERLRLVERRNASLEAQLHKVGADLREAQRHNEAKLHEVRASLLPLMRTLDTLRVVRNRLRSILKRH